MKLFPVKHWTVAGGENGMQVTVLMPAPCKYGGKYIYDLYNIYINIRQIEYLPSL